MPQLSALPCVSKHHGRGGSQNSHAALRDNPRDSKQQCRRGRGHYRKRRYCAALPQSTNTHYCCMLTQARPARRPVTVVAAAAAAAAAPDQQHAAPPAAAAHPAPAERSAQHPGELRFPESYYDAEGRLVLKNLTLPQLEEWCGSIGK